MECPHYFSGGDPKIGERSLDGFELTLAATGGHLVHNAVLWGGHKGAPPEKYEANREGLMTKLGHRNGPK